MAAVNQFPDEDNESKVFPALPDQTSDGPEAFYRGLDEEEQQERMSKSDDSFLADHNPDLAREREREYKDVEKHWVRKNGWLKIALDLAAKKRRVLGGNVGLRYLTLPAYYRLDVSLLIENDLIEVTQRDAKGEAEEIYVAAFETNPDKYGRMAGHRPGFKLFGMTSIEDALTSSTDGHYQQLRSLFPFDIVNLDLTTSLTPRHEGPYSQTMHAIETVFDLQSSQSSPWALFLTFRNLPSDWEQGASEQLQANLQKNLDDYPGVSDAFLKRYSQYNVEGLLKHDFKKCMSQSVAKWLVDRAHHHKFALDSMNCYQYTRYNPNVASYDIYKQTFVFSKAPISSVRIPTKGLPEQSWMLPNLVECIDKHKCLNVQEKIIDISYGGRATIMEDLQSEVNALCQLIN